MAWPGVGELTSRSPGRIAPKLASTLQVTMPATANGTTVLPSAPSIAAPVAIPTTATSAARSARRTPPPRRIDGQHVAGLHVADHRQDRIEPARVRAERAGVEVALLVLVGVLRRAACGRSECAGLVAAARSSADAGEARLRLRTSAASSPASSTGRPGRRIGGSTSIPTARRSASAAARSTSSLPNTFASISRIARERRVTGEMRRARDPRAAGACGSGSGALRVFGRTTGFSS